MAAPSSLSSISTLPRSFLKRGNVCQAHPSRATLCCTKDHIANPIDQTNHRGFWPANTGPHGAMRSHQDWIWISIALVELIQVALREVGP